MLNFLLNTIFYTTNTLTEDLLNASPDIQKVNEYETFLNAECTQHSLLSFRASQNKWMNAELTGDKTGSFVHEKLETSGTLKVKLKQTHQYNLTPDTYMNELCCLMVNNRWKGDVENNRSESDVYIQKNLGQELKNKTMSGV